jgi:hypothetical protein
MKKSSRINCSVGFPGLLVSETREDEESDGINCSVGFPGLLLSEKTREDEE